MPLSPGRRRSRPTPPPSPLGDVSFAPKGSGHVKINPWPCLLRSALDLFVGFKKVRCWGFVTGSCQVLQAVEVINVPEDEILIICFGEVLPLGEGTLNIAFKGTLNDKMHGFYRSVYDLSGEKKNMAVTQFETNSKAYCELYLQPSREGLILVNGGITNHRSTRSTLIWNPANLQF